MALVQTAASFRVDHGTLGGWNPGDATVLIWVRIANLPGASGWPNSRRLFSKGAVTTAPEFADFGARVDSVGNISFERSHYNGGAFTWASYRTSSTPLAATGVDKFVALVYTASGSNRGKIYVGDRTTPAALATLGTNTDPSGTADDLSSYAWLTLNSAALSEPLDAPCSTLSVCDAVLTQEQIWAFQQTLVPPATNRKLYVDYGLHGTGTQRDWSSNGYDGTVTNGATAAHVPLVPAWQLPQTVAARQSATAVLGGSAAAGITEADIVAGGQTITITLTGARWPA